MDIEVPGLDVYSRRILSQLSSEGTIISVGDDNKIIDKKTKSDYPTTTESNCSGGFSYIVAVAFSINYIMGTGFLTLPWAFAQTGYLSFLVVIVITIAAIFAANMMLESMARVDVYKRTRGIVLEKKSYGELDDEDDESGLDISIAGGLNYISNPLSRNKHLGDSGARPNVRFKDAPIAEGSAGILAQQSPSTNFKLPSETGDLRVDFVENNDQKAPRDEEKGFEKSIAGVEIDEDATVSEDRITELTQVEDRNVDDDSELYVVNQQKFEVVEQCLLFIGPFCQFSYMLFLSCYMFGSLWAYGTVFSNALASNLPIPNINSYLLYLLLFGCIVVPISCMELEEQIIIQVLLSLGRVLMVILMVSTILIATVWGSENDFGDGMSGATDLVAFDWSGIHHLLPIAAFAHIFHHSIPALSDPVQDKTQLSNIYTTTLVCCFLAYTSISLSVSVYFGSNTLSSSNLNWVHYGNNSSGFSYFMKRFVATFIVIFPALDVASAFPLNAVTLGNNLFSVAYGRRVHLMKNTWHKTAFRLAGAIPPLIMAAIVSDLGQITDYTGVTGFGIAFIFPPLLSYFSYKKLK